MSTYRIDSSDTTLGISNKLWISLAALFLCSCRSMAGGDSASLDRTSHDREPAPRTAVLPSAAESNSATNPQAGPRQAGPRRETRFRLEDEPVVSAHHPNSNGPNPRSVPGLQHSSIRQISHAELAGDSTQLAATGIRPRRVPCCPACGVENCQQHLCLPDSAVYLPPALRPRDEYLCDGGDRLEDVRLGRNGLYQGLDMEDTVASYRTKTGDIKIEASNRVCIYAPRFASVRKITGVTIHQQQLLTSTMRDDFGVYTHQQNLKSDFVRQRDELSTGRLLLAANDFRSHEGAEISADVVVLRAVHRQLLPYENFNFVRAGTMEESEKPKLARSILAAVTWTADEGVKIASNGIQLQEAVDGRVANNVVVYDMPEGKPHLRVAKLASTDNALPGETVDFTIRFDNLGDQALEDVSVVDNLTPRLELLEDSVSCSLDVEFTKAVNDGGSLMLRWSLKEPLEVNQGGVINFRCTVR